jgi:hypothetical protein
MGYVAMSKSLEEIVVVGFIALIALKFLSSSAALTAQTTYQNSTLGQVSGYTAVAENAVGTFVSDFGIGG